MNLEQFRKQEEKKGLRLLESLQKVEEPPEAPAAKLPVAQEKYTPEALIQLMVDNPSWTHKEYASYFGRPVGWFTQVLARDEFQALLDARRGEIEDPSITATMEERFRALTLRSLDVLQKLLDNPKVQDATVLKAAEIGIKALGVGGKGGGEDAPVQQADSLDSLADRLTSLLKDKAKGSRDTIDHRTQQRITLEGQMAPTDVLLQELKEVPDETALQAAPLTESEANAAINS